MSLQDHQAQFEQLKPRLQQIEFDHLKSRLDTAQLERTVAALHETLPEPKAQRSRSDAAAHVRPRAALGSIALIGLAQKPQYGGTL